MNVNKWPWWLLKPFGRSLGLVSHGRLYRRLLSLTLCINLFRCLVMVLLKHSQMLHSECMPLLKLDDIFQVQVRLQNYQPLFHIIEFIEQCIGRRLSVRPRHVSLLKAFSTFHQLLFDTQNFFRLRLLCISMCWTHLKQFCLFLRAVIATKN